MIAFFYFYIKILYKNMKYLKLFETLAAFNIYKASKDYIAPNVSVCEDAPTVIHYDSYVAPEPVIDPESGSGSGSGSDEPALEGNKVLCKYNVTDTSNPITLYYQSGSDSGSDSGSGSGGDTPMFSSMIVDGEEQEITNLYTFDTTGEHTVLFTLTEGVTSIGDWTFNSCSGLTSITIGNSVTSIGQAAFGVCSGLTSIIIGNSVTSIGESAFSGCSSLISVTIPNSVTSIGNFAFGNCSGLTSISVAANNQIYDSRNDCNAIIKTSTNNLILGCKNTIIPDSVTSIDVYAFSGCSGLTSVNIPDSVIIIDRSAFNGCSGLTSITIPDSVTSIGYQAFGNCSELTSITCNATTATTIQSNTFQNIKSGGILTVPAGSTGYDDDWMGTSNYYLGKYNWTKVEQ